MISVIVPAYNAQATVGECLRALLHQSVSSGDYEVIVVDDGSDDDTAQRAAASGVRVLRQAHHGSASARNLGVHSASGEIVLFTDADCVAARDWIERMRQPLADPSLNGVKGAYATRQRQVVARLAQLEFEERYDKLERSRSIDFFDSHALALRKSVLQTLGNFDTFFPNNEDVDLAYRYALEGKRLAFNRAAVVYHTHPDRWAGYASQKFWRGYWRMQVYKRYPGKMVADSYTPNSLKLQVFLVLLFLPCALLAVWWAPAAWLLGLMFVLLALSVWPLARLAWRIDRALLAVLPLFILVRALAIGLGASLGALTIVRLLPVIHPRAQVRREPGRQL